MDHYNFKFKLEINLENFAVIAVAVNLWEQADIKKKVEHHFKTADHSKHEYHTSKENPKWNKIVNQVSENANQLNLTEELKTKVKNLSEPIGDHIYYWHLFLLETLHLPSKFTDKIYWTPYGTIDEDKIFQMYWAKTSEFSNPSADHVVLLSCVFAQEGFIRRNLNHMIKKTISFLAPVKIINKKCNTYAVIVIWCCFFFSHCDKIEAIELYKKLKKENSTAKELFMKCLQDGLFKACKYFWNKLTNDEKLSMRVLGVKKCIDKWICRNCYEEEKCLEIIFFLINNLPRNKRFAFVFENDNLERIFQFSINIWPYQLMLEPMIDVFLDHLKYKQLEYFFISCLIHVTDKFCGKRYINKDVCRQVLYKVYPKVPKKLKLGAAFSNDKFIELLFKLFDVPVLSLFLKDKQLRDHKEQMLKLGDSKFKELIRSKDFELLDKFIKEVFIYKKDQKKFKLRINISQELINEGNVDAADKLINWISDSFIEKNLLRKEINPLKVCSSSKNFNYKLLDKLLSWQCDNIKERKSVKESMKNNEFICDKIIKIWNENDKMSTSKCLEFLKWLGESEEKAQELKDKLKIDDKFLEKFCDNLPSVNSFSRIDGLFKFLSVTPENILEIKEKIVKNLSKWIYRYIAVVRNFRMAEAIVDYVFVDEYQKRLVMKTIFSSLDGAKLIFDVLKTCSKEYLSGILFLFDEYVKPYGDPYRLREKKRLLDVKTVRELSASQIFSHVLDVLERGDIVNGEDILSHEIFTNLDF